MLIFRNFEADDLKIVNDALTFTRGQIDNYYRKIAEKVDRNLTITIWDECLKVDTPIDEAKAFFKKNEHIPIIRMGEEEFLSLMDAVASSLAFYRKKLDETHRITEVERFVELIARVDRILSHLPKKANEIALFFIVGGIVGPITEELFFRGILYGFFRKWGILIALVISTTVFVFAHPFFPKIPVTQLVGGIVFALAYEIEKNLTVPIVIHVLGNMAIFTLSLVS